MDSGGGSDEEVSARQAAWVGRLPRTGSGAGPGGARSGAAI